MGPIIRLARESDGDAIAEIYRPSVDFRATSFETEPPTGADMARRIAHTLPALPWLVCDVSPSTSLGAGGIAGYVYASKHHERAAYRWSVNVAVYIDEARRRSGVGRGLYTSLFAILTAQGYVNAYAGITLPNPGSVGLHESMGFERFAVYRKVGYKFGAWHDVGYWQLTLRGHDTAPSEPIDIPTLERDPRWPSLLNAGVPHVRPAEC